LAKHHTSSFSKIPNSIKLGIYFIPTMPSDLRLECATDNDAKEIAAVYIYSFAEDAHTACLFPGADQNARINDVANRFPAILAAPTTIYLKSLDNGNRVVAYSKWRVPEEVKKDLLEQGKVVQPVMKSDQMLKGEPVGLNDSFAEDFTEKLRALKTHNHTRRIGEP
jgi:hypothetical protein